MRSKFNDIFKNNAEVVGSLNCTSQSIALESMSQDLVAVGQAFHWFADMNTLREVHRILKPGGHLALVWNMEDKSVPWIHKLRQYYEKCKRPYISTHLHRQLESKQLDDL